jgi:metallo-beta-lactamase family protein
VGTVLGSNIWLRPSKRLLVDCRLFRAGRSCAFAIGKLPKPESFDWCVLTHAHLDHTGYLPRLLRDGFRGPIFANNATIEICGILLPDSAHLMEEDAARAGVTATASQAATASVRR